MPGISGIIAGVIQPAEKAPDSVSIEDVNALASDDMQAVDALIRQSLQSDVTLVSQVSEYIVTSGGKRLRPLIVLLAARALGYRGNHQIHSAAIIEFIHTATLLHDDVVDSSARRRGRDTANTVFGNQASVLVGDFLYSRAFQMMVQIGRMRVMQILADATNMIASGEVMQLMNIHDPDVTEADYRKVIYRKTARLFEAGAQIAAVLSDRDPNDESAMICYGQNLGTAFQLVDDALDYNASPEELGKNLGRHPMAPSISPKKTWEGLAGGTAATLGVAAMCKPLLGLPFAWGHVFALAGILVVAAPVGDLIESLFKRDTGIKDSSGLLLGHGGFLDRTDSLLYAAPPLLAYLMVTGLIG